MAQSQLMELGNGLGRQALGLVDGHDRTLAGDPQPLGNAPILRRQAIARIEHEDDDIALGDRGFGLCGHFLDQALGGHRLEATGVDNDVGHGADAPLAVVAITRQPREVRHQRRPRTGQPVEQGRLADVGPADQGDNRFHARGRLEASDRGQPAPACHPGSG